VDEGKGAVGLLLKDEATKQQLRTTIANTQSASAGMNETVLDFQSRDLPAKTERTLENARSITGQLNTAVQSTLAPDNMGEDGASNLRETLSNVNRGTTNLAEDTEALKHEFFFRGFFKKRGYYNLDEVTPKEYRTACEQKKIVGPRLWLQAASLVETDANGQEILSQAGRLSIDDQLTLVVDSLPGHLIIIEGYSQDGSPEKQFVTSRRRAFLVRRYLETHYHLNAPIFKNESARALLRILHEKGTVGILADQNTMREEGVFVDEAR
jgi:phospholipid/cholesterol/gamma-HCH transport system substrate-binding protein